MWCVPEAVAALTGWSREKVWLDILAQRHERGRRLTNVPGRIDEPHGGLHAAEALRTIERAGVEVADLWHGTRRLESSAALNLLCYYRTRPKNLVDPLERPALGFLILQRMHLAHFVDMSDHSIIPGLPVAKIWRVA